MAETPHPNELMEVIVLPRSGHAVIRLGDDTWMITAKPFPDAFLDLVVPSPLADLIALPPQPGVSYLRTRRPDGRLVFEAV